MLVLIFYTNIILYYIILYYIILYFYYIILYCIILYYIILYSKEPLQTLRARLTADTEGEVGAVKSI